MRKGDAITIVGVAVLLTANDGVCQKARIALSSVAPVVMRACEAEAILEGQTLSSELIDKAARIAVSESSPIDDLRASADYRRHCTGVLVRRLLNQARQVIGQ